MRVDMPRQTPELGTFGLLAGGATWDAGVRRRGTGDAAEVRTASLLVGKLFASSRQNALTAALKETSSARFLVGLGELDYDQC